MNNKLCYNIKSIGLVYCRTGALKFKSEGLFILLRYMKYKSKGLKYYYVKSLVLKRTSILRNCSTKIKSKDFLCCRFVALKFKSLKGLSKGQIY